MTITAKVIADSISPQGHRLTTFQLRYPKFIHGELMTHRKFSRNASSSRAIPVERMIQDILDDPAMPVYWGSNRPGMQAGDELEGIDLQNVQEWWLHARDQAIEVAKMMIGGGLHKQIANRILEPFACINVVCTATDYANFYSLRRHKDAQPEIHALADAMWDAQQDSLPALMLPGQWHLPYVSPGDLILEGVDNARKLSVARCARVSYMTHAGKEPRIDEDLALYERLVGSIPLHASPAEHQATPDEWYGAAFQEWQNLEQHGNFTGWRQFRKMLPNEFVRG